MVARSLLDGTFSLLWRGIMPIVPKPATRALARLLFSRSWKKFEAAARAPIPAQEARLLSIVRRNEGTVFGREHGFSSVRSVADFQRRVPVQSYDSLEPYILRMTRGEQHVLVSDPVRFFARTSGTTGAAKFIPITEAYLEEYRIGRRVWARQVAQVFPGLVRGTLLTIHSPRIEGRTEGGIPFGSITVAMGADDQGGMTGTLPVLRPFHRIPMSIFSIEDFSAKYYLLLRLAAVNNISLMAAINPSTLVLMCQKFSGFAPEIIRDCRDGTLKKDLLLDSKLRSELEGGLRPDPGAAKRIERSLAQHGLVRPPDVWPNLCGLLCWKGGAAPFYLKQFPRWFGELPVMDYGFAATEGNFTVVLSAEGSQGVTAVNGHFLEFIPEESRSEAAPPVLTVDQLAAGKRYFILVTGSHGLYRYDMNDVVEVAGFYRKVPELVFCHKGGNMISITGEKVGESHVVQAVTRAQEEVGVPLAGFCVTVRLDAEVPCFVFAVEPVAAESDERLLALLSSCDRNLRQANIEYEAKRNSLRLGKPILAVVRTGAFEGWRQQKVSSGSFDSHVKVPHLSPDPEVLTRLGVMRSLEAP